MIVAARSISQVITHMGVAFAVMYVLTGSLAFGGLAAIVEPVVNVLLLPFHQMAWANARRGVPMRRVTLLVGAEKISQVGMHMGVAFGVMYWATGSAAFGGLAAVLEPICNVAVLPYHDKVWKKIGQRVQGRPLGRIAYI